MKYNYIAIEGCIGAGKTTLAEKLSADFNTELVLERFEDNCFLPKFYKDPEHYAFPVEMSFLTDRYQQIKTLLSKRDLFSNGVIADYFIDKCAIFAKKNLNSDEYNLFFKVYEIIATYLPKPDLLIYLYNNPENLLKNIQKRGRSYEQTISEEYLNSIQNGYLHFLKYQQNTPVLILNTNTLDFVKNQSDYEKIRELLIVSHPVGITYKN